MSRSIPDIDVARITVLSEYTQRFELRKMKTGFSKVNYNPVRNQILDILNAQVNPLLHLPRTQWEKIEDFLKRKCKNKDSRKANIGVGKALYNFATDNNLHGIQHDFLPFAVSRTERVNYWSPIIINIDGRPTVPFIQPRRTKGLNSESRRFIFSVMHQRIRELDPDLASVRLAVLQFYDLENGERAVRPYYDDGINLLTFSEITSMVEITYRIWHEVLEERQDAARRTGL